MTTPEVITRYFDLINAERWEGFEELWTPDATVVTVGAPLRQGHAEILSHYRKLFRAFTKHLDTPTRVLPCGDAVTVEVRFDGMVPDGRTVSFDAVDVFDLRGDRICRLSNWYDLVHVRRMLAGDDAATAIRKS
jgi:ketosteroid isomerase-like protein